jgi:alkylation response protein AidB-like acyl-CoA dehydrogenase
MSYVAPVKDMLFSMKELADLEAVARLPGFEEAGLDTAQAVLEECARFSQEVLAPLNREGDVRPSSWQGGVVTTTAGFKEAFRQFGEAGWQGLQHPPEFGGQGLPKTIGAAAIEMINSANLSFALCPLLTDGAIEALLTAGSREQQQRFIPKMLAGEWTGTMNLTEPQAGSDLALVRTRAEPIGDGRYKIFGTKIFITYGEHDMAENIVHLVLARIAGAPEGVKGISLFLVPKFLVNRDGSLGARNDVWCVSIEHKLGIKASPTAVLQFGDQGGAGLDGPGAIGTLVGEENRGLEAMFIMMNAARYAVGMQGIAIAERAYQQAAAYAKERVQSRPVDGSVAGSATIIHHPDVRRMLMTMRAYTEGCRALDDVAARRRRVRRRAPRGGCRRAPREPGVLRVHGAPREGLQHRDEHRGREPRRPGPRRHGLHRGDRGGAIPARRPHPDDLRGHDGDPGQRPRRPQDGTRRRPCRA